MLYIGETGRCLRTKFGERHRAVTSNDANQPVARHFNNEPSVSFLVAMIAAKDMKCVSFPNLALSTLLALMNVLVTFNAHLLCLTHSLTDSPSFLFFTPFCSVYLCLCLVFILCNTIYISLFTLFEMKSI